MILILLILMGAVFLLFREIYARLWSEGLTAEITVEEPYIYAGGKAGLTEIVANRGRLPLPVIEVRFRLPKGPVFENAENVVISDHLYKRDVFSLRPREQVVRRYLVLCPRRGRYPVCDLTVKAPSFWHGRAYDLKQESRACLTVYAARTDVSGILAQCNAVLGTRESRRRTLEDPFAWASIRAYTPQDPMRNINWKASARSGEMMVNTYTSMQAVQFRIFLDAIDERIVRQEDLTELGISAAASLAARLIESGQETGLYVYSVHSDLQPGQENQGKNAAQPEAGNQGNHAAQPEVGNQGNHAAQPEVGNQGNHAAQPGVGICIPPARGQAQLTRIEQALTADLAGYAARRIANSGNSGRADQDISAEKIPEFAQWAVQTSASAAAAYPAGECINVFISKEEDTLEELEKLLRKGIRGREGYAEHPTGLYSGNPSRLYSGSPAGQYAGNRGGRQTDHDAGHSMPAVLVRPVLRNGRGVLEAVTIL